MTAFVHGSEYAAHLVRLVLQESNHLATLQSSDSQSCEQMKVHLAFTCFSLLLTVQRTWASENLGDTS